MRDDHWVRTVKFSANLEAALLVLTAAACSGGSLGSLTPAPDPDGTVRRARASNPSPTTSLVIFAWSLREPDLQLEGMGFARLENPDRARLDLYMENNEAVLTASLVEDQLRAREGTQLDVVPSPALLWASLGVFRPGEGATRLSAESYEGEASRLTYLLADGDELRYELRSGRMVEAELRHDGDAVHRVTLVREGDAELPTEATYRNLARFSELRVTIESVERVDSHPSDIWYSVQ